MTAPQIGGATAPISAVVLDIGGVVVRWRTAALAPRRFPSLEAMAAELSAAGFPDWYDSCHGRWEHCLLAEPDAGRVELFARYLDGLTEALAEPVPGMAELTAEIARAGIACAALTNATAEAADLLHRLNPEVMQRFDPLLVSGREGVAKPRPEIFARLRDRAGFKLSGTLFVDDSPVHCQAAAAVGLATHVFTSAARLRTDLVAWGVL